MGPLYYSSETHTTPQNPRKIKSYGSVLVRPESLFNYKSVCWRGIKKYDKVHRKIRISSSLICISSYLWQGGMSWTIIVGGYEMQSAHENGDRLWGLDDIWRGINILLKGQFLIEVNENLLIFYELNIISVNSCVGLNVHYFSLRYVNAGTYRLYKKGILRQLKNQYCTMFKWERQMNLDIILLFIFCHATGRRPLASKCAGHKANI